MKKVMLQQNVLSWDVETNGLIGEGFAIGAVLYNKEGKEVASFYARCPISGEVDPWVEENVLPQMVGLKTTHQDYEEMLRAFFEWLKNHKTDADVIFHMGVPVEARVIIDAHDMGILGAFEGAYPWIDVAGVLIGKGFNPTSVDSYNESHGIEVPTPEPGGTHNPLYDSRAAALCYIHLLSQY